MFSRHLAPGVPCPSSLSPDEADAACAILLRCVERLFDDAATKLNLKSLMGFMSELSFCSHKQLLTILPRRAGPGAMRSTSIKKRGQTG